MRIAETDVPYDAAKLYAEIRVVIRVDTVWVKLS